MSHINPIGKLIPYKDVTLCVTKRTISTLDHCYGCYFQHNKECFRSDVRRIIGTCLDLFRDDKQFVIFTIQPFDRAIGEEFIQEGKRFVVKEATFDNTCVKCDFYDTKPPYEKLCTRSFADSCYAFKRKDKKNVVFKRIKP